MIACDCAVCRSNDPRDRRSRPGLSVEYDGRAILVDTGPELRLQCLACDVRRCDAVLFTHHHVDHLAGLDDLRRFNWTQKSAIPCYGQAATLNRLREMFRYAFEEEPGYPSHKPQLELREIEGPLDLFGRTIVPVPLLHGSMPVLGYRIGSFAYCTDVSTIPEESWRLLERLEVLILDALRRRPHPTHFNLEQAVEAAKRIGARQTFFTHIAHELGHAETNAQLPNGMALAYDGLTLAVESHD